MLNDCYSTRCYHPVETQQATIHTGQVEWVLLYCLIMWVQPLITGRVAALLSWHLAFTVTSGVLSRTWTRLSDKTANRVRCVQIQLPFWAAMGLGLSSGDGKQSKRLHERKFQEEESSRKVWNVIFYPWSVAVGWYLQKLKRAHGRKMTWILLTRELICLEITSKVFFFCCFLSM